MPVNRSMGPGKKSATIGKVPEEKYVCPHCGRTLKKSDFMFLLTLR